MSGARRLRRVGAALLALGLGLAVAAALLEVGVRLLLGEQVRFPRHVVGAPFGVRINEPGARYWHTSPDVHVEFRINARGLRDDRDFDYAKPPGRVRIVSLGDSFTAGYEVAQEATFSQVLERRLRAAGIDAEVLNAGVSGYSNAEAALYLERELLRYEPDVVLVSFYGNDLVDNVRSGLFRLEDGRLVQARDRYVPAGRLGDFLNTNPLFNFLSERSNAFTLLKERLTLLVKRGMVAQNVRELDRAEAGGAPPASRQRLPAPATPGRAAGGASGIAPERALAGAIFQRIADTARGAGAQLVVQSIPSRRVQPLRLVEAFPLEAFDTTQPGVHFFAAREVLLPYVGRELLYYERSHGHWTPLAHRVSGEALAELMLREGLVAPPVAR